jgi:hypothetical protein
MNTVPLIHCIGDSHSLFFHGEDNVYFSLESSQRNDSLLPYFKVYPIGPALAYNLYKEAESSKWRDIIFSLLGNRIPNSSYVLLCFGEIDCRCHLLKQAFLQNKPIEEIVKICVDRYFDFVLEVKEKGFNVMIWGAVASALDTVVEDKGFPRFGTNKERNKTASIFNKELFSLCLKKDIPFISIFNNLVDEEGVTIEDYYMDQIHLSQRAMPLALEKIRYFVNI